MAGASLGAPPPAQSCLLVPPAPGAKRQGTQLQNKNGLLVVEDESWLALQLDLAEVQLPNGHLLSAGFHFSCPFSLRHVGLFHMGK